MKEIETVCPICGALYEKEVKYQFKNVCTHHHILPRFWYKDSLRVHACFNCHILGFHKMFPMGERRWPPVECVEKWVKFCKTKGKNAYEIYPQLRKLRI